MINPLLNKIVFVAPTTVVLAVTAVNTISLISRGFAPAVSVKNTRPTIAEFKAAVACAEVKVIDSTLEPFAPAVNNVTNVPEPSLAVFAAVISTTGQLGVNVKIGVVFAGMILNLSYVKLLYKYNDEPTPPPPPAGVAQVLSPLKKVVADGVPVALSEGVKLGVPST